MEKKNYKRFSQEKHLGKIKIMTYSKIKNDSARIRSINHLAHDEGKV
jgi:hypothetical protein